MAITEKYVSSLAAGGGTGLSAASPLTFSEMVTAINAGTEAGSRFNVLKDGTYSRGASDTITGVGTATSPVVIRGYLTAIGDGHQGRTLDGTGPLVTTHMPVITYGAGFNLVLPASSYTILESLNFGGAMTTSALVGATSWTFAQMRSCAVTNTVSSGNASAACVFAGSLSLLIDCDFLLDGSGSLSAVSKAVNLTNSIGRVIACRIRSASSIGVQGTGTFTAKGNTIYRCGATGITASTGATIDGNTIVGCTGDGLALSGTNSQSVTNNLITDNGGYGINAAAGVPTVRGYNRLDRNTSGAAPANDWATATAWGDNTTAALEADEYEDAASDDYRLLSTSPAVGNGHFPHADIGALQRVASGGGGVSLGKLKAVLAGGRL